ncbi:hypothetical protein HBB16_08275 [Pseudonocardia sp. MCCB 268]|nr:hypothetical protein [Pseudonocardia cytotoxica]
MRSVMAVAQRLAGQAPPIWSSATCRPSGSNGPRRRSSTSVPDRHPVADVADPEAAPMLRSPARSDRFGRLDVMINNAAVLRPTAASTTWHRRREPAARGHVPGAVHGTTWRCA